MLTRCLWSLLILALIFSTFKASSQQVSISATPSWIIPTEPDFHATPRTGDVGGYYYLIIEHQEHVRKQESFRHNAYKIITNEGIQEMADLSITFDPIYQKLIFHKLLIHRDGKKIDRLNKNAIRTIQREQEMDRYLYDGSLTAIINLKDIRIGDVVEYAYTVSGYNPIYDGHISHRIYLNYSLPYEKAIKRLVVASETKLYFKFNNGAPKPVEETSNGNTSYTWTSSRVAAFIEDNNLPSWHDPYQNVQVSDLQTWSDVIAWSLKHFQLNKEEKDALSRRIDQQWKGSDHKTLLEIIRFVQDEVRYLGFEAGLNSHKPHAPVKVFDQRFGDCKDKSLLLSAILQLKGIAAHPILVNTTRHEYLRDDLPSIHAFDHCVVEMELDNKKIYVDPTISNQGGNLNNIFFPNYGAGLVIRQGGTDLTDLPTSTSSGIHEQDNFELNILEREATMAIRTIYKGGDADGQRSYFASNSLESTQKAYVNFYGNLYPDLEADGELKITDDRDENTLIVEEKYKVPSFWKDNADVEGQTYAEFYSLSIENLVNVSKSSQRKSPYRLSYPTSFQHTLNVELTSDWNIDADEKDIVGDGYKYRYEVSFIDNNLKIYHHYITSKDHIPAKNISKFVSDHQSIRNNLSYTITYGGNVANDASELVWAPVTIGIISVGLAVFLIWYLYYRYDPVSNNSPSRGQSIGGWLILVAIGLCLTPLRLIYDLFSMQEFFDPASWSALWSAGNWLLFSVFLFEYVYNIFYFFFSILIIALFFNKRSSTPLLISILYGCTFAVTLMDTLIAMNLNDAYTDAEQSEYYRSLFRSFLAAAIWIPYFNMSERVKETFVERLEPTQGSDNTITYTLRN